MYHAYLPVEATAGADATLWNATITAEYDDADTQSIGWNSGHIGSVGYNAPTMDGTFILNGTTYTVRGLYEQVAKAPASVDLRISSYIPESERGSVYVAVGDARCSIAAAQATRGNTGSFYKWNQTVFPSPPFSNGANITAAILYNSNYLTLNGNSTVTVQKGDAYADAGAATPDGATIANNTDLDTLVPGNYTIQYTASKGCGVLDTAARTIVVEADKTAKPEFAYATLDQDTGEMTIAFDVTINVNATDLTKMYVSDAEQSNEVSLNGADFNSTAPASDTLSMTLTPNQLSQITAMDTPQLDIEAGAVALASGNTIDDAPDNHILIFRAGFDTVLWNATISSKTGSGGERVGWTLGSLGSIAYNPPTANNMFVLNETAYAVSGFFMNQFVYVELILNAGIPESERSSLYAVLDDKRCSFSTVVDAAAAGGKKAHRWDANVLGFPFANNRDTDAAIIHNPDYLTLNGNSTVTVQQGDAYADEGATTPDGATIADNANIVDTSVPGNYTIQYTASKGCGVLDTAVRTIVVEANGTAKPEFAHAVLDRDTGKLTIIFDKIINVAAADLTKMHVSDAGQSNEVPLDGADFNSTAPDSDTLSMTLTPNQLSQITAMETPQLDIEAGAVALASGNAIDDAPDNHILIFRAGSDTVLWNATITAGSETTDGATGWSIATYPSLGSIAHHSPTTNNMFVANGTAYALRGMFYVGGSDTYIQVDNHIEESDRNSLHITFENKRCSFSTRTPAWAGIDAHVWHSSIIVNPFPYSGAKTDVAILYNSNYLKLNGADAATVRQGDSYTDEGAETPDGATVTSNASRVDTSVPGTYKIHYNAAKGCGVLDTAIRTVEVTDASPSFAFASLNTRTGGMTIAFDEKIHASAADLTKMHVSETGQANEVALTGADFDSAAPNSTALSMTLNSGQLSRITLMAAPQLDIDAGAVSDLAGNAIDAAPDSQILTFAVSPDIVLWNATITSEYRGLEGATGWDNGSYGNITHNAPTMNNTFSLNGTVYTVQNLDYQEQTTPPTTYLGLSSYIPQSERDSTYIAMGDARCSLKTAEAAGGGARLQHSWYHTVLANPFTAGANTTAVILYNENYLTLIGGDAATVPQGGAYADAGAATPDNAAIASNASRLDTTVPGAYKIQYNATKGCGLLDTVVRTVTVEEPKTSPVFVSASLDHNTSVMTVAFSETIDVSAANLRLLYVSEAGQANQVSLNRAVIDDAASDSDTLSMTLSTAQMNRIIRMSTPQLDIRAGAVSDLDGNAIEAAPDNPITVIPASNRPPIAPDATAETTVNTSVTITPAISDPDEDAVRISAVSRPSNGNANHADTTITYTPNRDFAGTDTFSYTATDGQNSTQGTVTVTVNLDSAPPEIESAELNRDGTLRITFSEPVDASEIDLGMLYVTSGDSSSRTSLSGARLASTADGDTISIILAGNHLNTISLLLNPQLEIGAGAVSDLAGNAISDTFGNPTMLAGSLSPGPGTSGGVPLGGQNQPSTPGRSGGGGGGGGGGGSGGAAAPAEFAGLYSVMWDCNAPSTAVILDSNLAAEITIIAGSESFTPVQDAVQNLDGRAIYTAGVHAGIMLLKVNANDGSSTSKTINTLDRCTGQIEYSRYAPDAPAPVQAVSAQPAVQQPPAEPDFAPVPAEPDDASEPPDAAVPAPAEPDEIAEPGCGPGQVLSGGECVPRPQAPPADDSGCLIATAAYGTELAPQVQMLRELRDDALLSTDSGASFVDKFNSIYYTFSPGIADMQRESPAFREAVKALITPMIHSLSVMSLAEENSEASVLTMGSFVILLNLVMYLAAPAVTAIAIVRRFGMGRICGAADIASRRSGRTGRF